MYQLIGAHAFDAAHYLKGHDDKCRNLHGHRWTVEYAVKSDMLCKEGAKQGMVLDFGDLKQRMNQYIDTFDHALLIDDSDLSLEEMNFIKACKALDFRIVFLQFRTTAENLSRYFYAELSKRLQVSENTSYIHLNYVKVYETPNNCAMYTLEESNHENRGNISKY